ncbi:LacI family DNA-binding transcriptional regulator [Galactobacter sp.]|uniref:LacI family DNA-binding transcriptional regulator n=1 Tax=Galactobacter sp. TaxID=2676125 RepID=UPI0025BDD63A|nr:LacI family DNA-binding transcriptional regulator [Galactobacter sp.]
MPPRGRGTPTISDVAQAAGVGRATVARTLGGYGAVSERTRIKVLAAAEELGYRPNSVARSMATRRTQTIGVVLADVANPFFAEVLRGISATTSQHGYDVLLISSEEEAERERAAVDVLVNKLVDGMILAPSGGRRASVSHLAVLGERGIPLVLVDRTVDGLDADAVVINNRAVARDSVDELVRNGHRRIGFLWGPTTSTAPPTLDELRDAVGTSLSSEGDRLLGYLDALEQAGIEPDPGLVSHVRPDEESAALTVESMLAMPHPPTAFLATETSALTGMLRALRAEGLRYPRDVSLIAFDDSPWAAVIEPPMTVVAQPARRVGIEAASLLLRRMQNPTEATVQVELAAELAHRESVAAPKR